MPGGKLGCGTILIVIIGALVFGVDPGQMLGTVESMQGSSPSQQQGPQGTSAEELCNANAYSLEACNALGSLNETWEPMFAQGEHRLPAPDPQLLSGRHAFGMRRGIERDGAVLLPQRSGHLPRHLVSTTRWTARWARAAISPAITSWRMNTATMSSI